MAKFTYKKGDSVKHVSREDVREELESQGWELEKKKAPVKKAKKIEIEVE